MTDNITPRGERENFTVTLKELSELRHGDNKDFVSVEDSIFNRERHYICRHCIVKRLKDEKYFHFYYDEYFNNPPYDEGEVYIVSEVFPKEKTIIVYE